MVVYIEDTTMEDKVLVVIFCIFIILIMIVFFSKFLVQEETDPINISQAQFDLITNKAQLPEGLDNQTLASDVLNAADLTLSNLEQLTGLLECPEGECAIDLQTGVKRCPQDKNVRLVYNKSFEGCSSKFFCTEDTLPYAILSSGETDLFGVCEKDVECRCTSNIVCPKYVVSSFNLRNGSGGDSKTNYFFDQTTLGDEKIAGYESIIIPPDVRGEQFCNLNPSFSDRITGGCDFSNADNDILGCRTSEDFYKVIEKTFQNSITSKFAIGFQDTPENNFSTLQFQSSLNISNVLNPENQTVGRPEKGFAYISPSENNGNIQILSYSSRLQNSQTINGDNFSSVGDLTTTSIGNDPLSINLGTSNELANKTISDTDFLEFMNIIYTGCSSSEVSVSNKNMLLCLQNSSQPCSQGLFSYRIDDKPASDFCQFNPTLAQYVGGDNSPGTVLDDPQKYTLSCVIGPGCNGNYPQTFCKDGDCNQAISDYISLFQDYDTSAINGVWELVKSDTPLPGVITFSYDQNDGFIISNGGLLTIQPGDYFSTVRQKYQKLVIANVNVTGNSNVFPLGSIEGLQVGFLVYSTGYKGTVTSIDSVDNKITVSKDTTNSSPKISQIKAYTLIQLFKPLVSSSDDGQQYGKFIIQSSGKILPTTIFGDGQTPTVFDSIPDTIFVFKQFGFNGPNYNTDLRIAPDNTVYRQYSMVSQWWYWLNSSISSTPLTDTTLRSPLSAQVIPLVILCRDNQITFTRNDLNSVVFSSPESDFKEDLSFYYPVWNSDKNSQFCIKCKPALYTYVKIGPNSANVTSVVIQFSGRDFSQYMYYPPINQVSGNYFFELTTPKSSPFIFNTLTAISQDENSNARRIVLDIVNPNLPYSSDVSSSYYTDNPHYVLDSNNVIRRQVKLVNIEDFPFSGKPPSSVYLRQFVTNTEVNVLEDAYIPFNSLSPDENTLFSISDTNNYYFNYTRKDGSNWFAGKKYIYNNNMYLVNSQTKIVRVELIEGKQVIWTDSIVNAEIPKTRNTNADPTVIQIYSTTDTLDLGFYTSSGQVDTEMGIQTVYPVSICDNRITNLGMNIDTSVSRDIGNLPIVKFSKYRNLL